MASAGVVTVDFAADSARFNAELRKVNAQIEGFGSQASKAANLARNAFAAISLGAVASQITDLVAKSLELAGAIQDATEKAGVSVEAFSELNAAARLAGLGTSDLSNAFTKFQKELAGGGDKIKSLGIDLDRFRQLEPDRQFEALAESIAAIKDPAVRAGAAVEVFGESGAKLLPLFNEGAKGIQMARQEAQRLGLALTTDQAKALDQAGKDIDKLKIRTENLAVAFTVALAPSIDFVARKLQNLLTPVSDQQKELQTLTDQFEQEIKRRKNLLQEVEQLQQRKQTTFVPGLDAEFDKAIAEAQQKVRVTDNLLNFLNQKIQRFNIDAEQAKQKAEAPVPPGVVDPNGRTFGTKAEEQEKELARLNEQLLADFDRNQQEVQQITEDLAQRSFESFAQFEGQKTRAAIVEQQRRTQAEIEAANFSERLAQEQAEREAAMRSQSTDLVLGSLVAIGNANKKFAAIAKLANIAQAVRNTSEAVTKTLASVPFPYNIAAAAVVGAAGLAQVASIRSTPEIGDVGGRGVSIGSAPSIATQPTSPFNQPQQQLQAQPAVTQVIFQGTVMAAEEAIVDIIRKATDNDVIVIGSRTAQAQMFAPAE